MLSSHETTATTDLIVTWAKLCTSHNIDAVLALYTPDFAFEDVARATAFHGSGELRAYGQTLFSGGYPDVRLQLTAFCGTDQYGAAEWTMRAAHLGDRPGLSATGKHIEVRAPHP